MKDDPIHLLMIGCGPHGQRFYLPSLRRIGGKHGVILKGVIELSEVARQIRNSLAWPDDASPEVLSVEPFRGNALPRETARMLDEFVERLGIGAVIICTDPTTHRSYGEWALARNLHLLMDKPVSTRTHVVSDPSASVGLVEDYDALLAIWNGASARGRSVFHLCVHRRFHPVFAFIEKTLREVCKKTTCPLSHYHAYHSDGQWRFPGESLTQRHHSYNEGHGKLSHSGFHFLDCIVRMRRAAAEASGKDCDSARILASFVQPDGLLHQLGEVGYLKLFGENYRKVSPGPDAALMEKFSSFGEIDVDAIISFETNGVPVSTANLTLLHNGFSRRGWMQPDKDLYKGNGRVKHEEHRLHVGPFLCIHALSWQAKDKHDTSSEAVDFQPGGNNHFEVHVFRNSEILGGKPYECHRIEEFPGTNTFDPSRLFIEQVKEAAVDEFFACIRGDLAPEHASSAFSSHRQAVRLMAATYQANIATRHGGPGAVTIPWSDMPGGI